ncbi:hypothetical protein CH63R_01546 [Colletotrichum higginsianum IMI 349063]|uniref:Uncharacterized protein n=1 Tax=Colletotrichum higginsianum (strain IMI 349063) TaxID=759273 RepID=A0A1B7YWE8_COLHI|nr:hypothetical protein CH63R_01546 [Colletotrichum higginsianum IMI 349063]OBR16366.1 hypothetical protein CH63R_01546 [Colletotrichum higginsianum IMI 349063]
MTWDHRNEEKLVVPARQVDPQKLSVLLKQKFGEMGLSYRVEMRHNSYRIYAQRPLSPQMSIALLLLDGAHMR